MLKAFVKSQNIFISHGNPYTSSHEVRKAINIKNDLICQFCQTMLIPSKRGNSRLFFRHHSGQCPSPIPHHPESHEHEQGKTEIAQYFASLIKEDNVLIETEKHLPDCGKNGRIADVAVVYPNGNLLIGECQLAKISISELEQRTLDYFSIGADVLWFLGKNADTQENRAWAQSMFGAVGLLEFSYSTEKIN